MNDIDIPILKKTYDLYKTFHEYRKIVPKQDRFTIYERSEDTMLEILENLLEAAHLDQSRKKEFLETASVKLNTLRFLIRMLKDVKSIDMKKYIILEGIMDEIGRMLGGWIRSAPHSGR
jgi:hypothetical protein